MESNFITGSGGKTPLITSIPAETFRERINLEKRSVPGRAESKFRCSEGRACVLCSRDSTEAAGVAGVKVVVPQSYH